VKIMAASARRGGSIIAAARAASINNGRRERRQRGENVVMAKKQSGIEAASASKASAKWPAMAAMKEKYHRKKMAASKWQHQAAWRSEKRQQMASA